MMAARKKFIDVELPLIEETARVLGTPKELDKKTIKLDLTRKLRGKGVEIVFRIFNQEEKLVAFPKKISLLKFYIRRMIRKQINYVEDSFRTDAKDIRVIIKPFLITRKRVSRAVRKNLRNTAKEFLINYAKDRIYLEISQDILDGVLQKQMLPKLKKVYPLSFCDIRVFETKELEKADLKSKIISKPKIEKKISSISKEDIEDAKEKLEKVKKKKEAEEKKKEKAEAIKKEKKKVVKKSAAKASATKKKTTAKKK